MSILNPNKLMGVSWSLIRIFFALLFPIQFAFSHIPYFETPCITFQNQSTTSDLSTAMVYFPQSFHPLYTPPKFQQSLWIPHEQRDKNLASILGFVLPHRRLKKLKASPFHFPIGDLRLGNRKELLSSCIVLAAVTRVMASLS